jgi:hypothetical protein
MKASGLFCVVAMVGIAAWASDRADLKKPSAGGDPPSEQVEALESRIQELERRLEELDQRQGSIERFQPRPFPKAPNRPEPAFRFWSEQEINGTRVFVIPCRNWNDGGIR